MCQIVGAESVKRHEKKFKEGWDERRTVGEIKGCLNVLFYLFFYAIALSIVVVVVVVVVMIVVVVFVVVRGLNTKVLALQRVHERWYFFSSA